MGFDGAQADVELVGDLGIRATAGDGEQHFFFAAGQRFDRLLRFGWARRSKARQQPGGDTWSDESVAPGSCVDSLSQ